MSSVGQRERVTQNRVVELLQRDIAFRYPGDWSWPAGDLFL